ncbi:hypothetical protein MAHJHV57_54190 [Mycobacterium avium subsp. hominissuis]
MVGKDYEEGGMIKHGSMMINAVSNSTVPHISLLIGASYGAGHYGMCGTVELDTALIIIDPCLIIPPSS